MAYTTINKATDNFNATLYTGNGSSLAVDTGIDLTANGGLCIAKNRSASNKDWYWVDTVRGASKTILSNGTGTEQNYTTGITGFNNNGFQVGSATQTNGSSNTLVGYNWKAGTSVAGASNTDGSITSTVTANTTAGFSIVKWTGSGANGTIGHGLGSVPKAVIVKKLNSSENWFSYHEPLGNTGRLHLNTTDAVANNSGYWNSTTPSSSVIYLGSNGGNNASGDTYLAYCFADVQGYSKMGSYVGNGNADGTFVYTGFKPAWVMVKKYSATENWQMTDSVRDNNVSPNFARLMANTADAEATNTTWATIEKFSNGFKLGGTDGVSNGSGTSYIYMAFAEAPLVGTNNIPCTAR